MAKKDDSPMINIVGIPFDDNSSFMFGAAQAPKAIREGFNSHASNLSAESGYDLSESSDWQDIGDLEIEDSYTAFKEIQAHIAKLLADNNRIISLGGDHSITYPIIRAYAEKYPGLNILQLDAHPDLYDSLDGNKFSHACPFARIMEKDLAARLVQVGIRSITPHGREQAKKFGVELFEMSQGVPSELSFDGPVYLSLDLDCLDPAFAPGVSHYEPGGMSVREVISLINQFDGQLVGADIVEYNPTRDFNGVTGMVGGKLLKEITARMIAER